MSKRTSRYPEDEFDQVDPRGLPAGVHRTPRSRWRGFLPFLVVIVVCAGLGVAAVHLALQTPGSPLADLTASANPTTDTPEDPDATDPDAVDPTDPADVEPSADPTTEEPPPAEPADTTIAVRVLNNTGRGGVAGAAKETLEAADWSDVTAADYKGDTIEDTMVLYRSPATQADAQAIADLLGITEVVEAPNLTGPLSVILSGDYGK